MRFGARKVTLIFGVLFSAISALAQNNGPSPQAATQDPGKIIQFLSTTISWYRQLPIEQKLATEPSDLTFVQENRRVAEQVVQLAFEYARSQAQLQAKQPNQQRQNDNTSQYQGLRQAVQKVEQQIQETQIELDSVRKKLSAATGARRTLIQSQIDELQSELGLLQARRDALQGMVEFVNTSSSGGKGAGLRAQIEELARSVP
jgi:chromosome segregation ATPase